MWAAILLAGLVLLVGVGWGANRVRHELTLGTDCGAFRFSAADWHSQPGRSRMCA